MERLIVKNFGPLKDVDIELNKINLFIGENGSGKSVLAKIITIFLDFNKITEKFILKKIKELHIDFITNETFIKYSKIDSENNFFIELKNYKVDIANNVEEINLNKQRLREKAEILIKQNLGLNSESFHEMINKLKKEYQKDDSIGSRYIPAERNFISLFNRSINSILVAEVPLPKFLLSFMSEFEKAGNELKELEFLNVKYVNGDGLDRHKVYFNNKDYLPLEFSSSGIQSALPLYLTLKYFVQKYMSIIIEEPEQNLFPKAQKETVEYIVGELGVENKLFMMTHSPYILTALNNLILANDVKEQKGVEALEGIVEENYCVPFEEVSAYSLVDGKSVNIMDKEDRIIGVNVIDSISDEVSETFDKLLAKLD